MAVALQVLMFFPRGGSAQVVRYLAREIAAIGGRFRPRVVAGSLGPPGGPADARAFFAGLDLVAVDYDAALAAPDPIAASPPFHPSYEDRPGAPDRVMAALDDDAFEHLVAEWERILGAPGVLDDVEVAHLHHLTPAHEALARLRPDLPVLTHLHGTELLMLEEIDAGATWPHGGAWAERMRGWAARSARVLVGSEPGRERGGGRARPRPRRRRRGAERRRPARLRRPPRRPGRARRLLGPPPVRRAARVVGRRPAAGIDRLLARADRPARRPGARRSCCSPAASPGSSASRR